MATNAQRFDGGPEWDPIAGLIGRLHSDPVTDFDVARLRHRVRGTLAQAPPPARTFLVRFAAVAATVLVGVASIFVVLDGRDQRPAGGPSAVVAFSVSRVGGSTVIFDFGAADRVHRIVKTNRATPGAPGEVNTVAGRTFVDAGGQLQPGQVVFYRID